MAFRMWIDPPASRIDGEPLSGDWIEMVIEGSTLLDRAGCKFHVSGFGDDSWPVDVSYDLASIVEQLPEVLESLRASRAAVLDFYGQGVERQVQITPIGERAALKCVSQTSWEPREEPDDELQSLITALESLRGQFVECLDLAGIPSQEMHKAMGL